MLRSADTFHLPTLNQATRIRDFRGVPLVVSQIEPSQVGEVAQYLRHHAAPRLQNCSHEDIIGLLIRAARLWLADDSTYMTTALELLPDITGYSRPVIEYYLQHFFGQITCDHLHRLLVDSQLTTAAPPLLRTSARLVTHFCSGNIPGLAIESILFSLLARAPSLVKVSSDEPLLGALFARSLKEISPDLAKCVAVAWWPGGSVELEVAACESAEVVVATGDDDTVDALRKIAPPGARFVAHPHKISVGLVSEDCLNVETAAALAKDVALFDQQGCLSPQIVFVECVESSEARSFALKLHESLEEIGKRFPHGRLSMEEFAHLQQVCSTLEFAGASVWRTSTQPFRCVVLCERPGKTSAPLLLRGGVTLHPVDYLSRFRQFLQPLAGRLQAVGVAMPDGKLADIEPMLYTLGVSRVCRVGEMQTPPLGWKADGVSPLEYLLIP